MKDSLKLFLSSVYIVHERIGPMIKAIILPSLLSIIIEAINTQNQFLSIVIQIARLMLYTYIAVSIHRIVLVGIDAVPAWGFKPWTFRETKFFIFVLGFMLLESAIMLVGFNIGGWYLIPAALIIGAFITARFSLVFPASAVDRKLSLAKSWFHTKGKTILVVMTTLVWPIVFSIPVYFLIWLITAFMDLEMSSMLFEVLSDLYLLFFITIVISSLSLTYLYILGKENV